MFHDIDKLYNELGIHFVEPGYVVCNDVLYADDTMLVSGSAVKIQLLLDFTIKVGKQYGLDLNWSKTVVMRINNDGLVLDPSLQPIKHVRQAVYLGGLLHINADSKPEVTRRLGEARGVFRALTKCWNHAGISKSRKLCLFDAIVVPKLLYNLESLWLLQADRHRLDSFQASCLRKILGIQHSYYSRVSNATVLTTARADRLSEALRTRQTQSYERICSLPNGSYLRSLVCQPGTSTPRQWHLVRRRGRPKLQWAHCVYRLLQ